jgi:hypothetical protein
MRERSFLALDVCGFGDIFGGKLTERSLRFGVGNGIGVPPAFGGLIP